MNGAHWHLVVNHLPVVLAPTGLVVLALGWLRRNDEALKIGLGLVVAAALFAVAADLTGDGAAEMIGHLPGVVEAAIEEHEEAAEVALWVVILAGAASLAGLIIGWRRKAVPRWLTGIALVLTLVGSGLLARAANLGGLIRHPEIAPHAAVNLSPAR